MLLSKDTGFDPLISRLKKRGFNVPRYGNPRQRIPRASAAASAHARLFFVVKVDKKNIPPRTVLRDLEEIYSSLESALSG